MALINIDKPIQMLKCNLCGWEWIPRKVELPARCPKCGTDRWQEERKRPPIAEQIAAAKKRREGA